MNTESSRQVVKRDGTHVPFDKTKIRNAIKRAADECDALSAGSLDNLTNEVVERCNCAENLTVENIQDMVEETLMAEGLSEIARHYIKYRQNKDIVRASQKTDDEILALVDCRNEEANEENSNKNPTLVSTQRDYIAGIVSKDIARRRLLPEDVVKAHDAGLIHVHDMDYALQRLHNCDLVNLDDMLQNGTMIGGAVIEKPHSFSTACNIACQIALAVASQSYGGQTWSYTPLAKFVDVSRQSIRKEVYEELEGTGLSIDKLEEIVESRLKKEITRGIQTIQYQILTMSSCNGQAPFVSTVMYLNEAGDDEQLRHDLAMVIEEVIRQRYQGIKNEKGVWISPAFPKLLFVLEEDNVHENSKYFYLTQMAAKCSAKRLVPDYISEKKMKEYKIAKGQMPGEGDVFPCMGAAVGYETVSISVDGTVYDDIEIKHAFKLIRDRIRYTSTYDVAQDKKLIPYRNVCGVYKLIHKPTGLYYIGASTNIGRRLAEHRYSFMHKGTLGDRYLVNDYCVDNLEFELLEKCNIDDMYVTESKYVNFKQKDPMCVNQKDPINNGNFTSKNHLDALQGKAYSTYVNGWTGTWVKAIPDFMNILIKSHGEWVPIRNIMYNNKQCPLELVSARYVKGGSERAVRITSDHPLETQRGRVQAKDLVVGDLLIDADNGELYAITRLVWSEPGTETFDFTTDNDMFDLSGIVSHNCRSFLSVDETRNGWNNVARAKNYDGKPKYYGRFNGGVCTINLPDVGLSAHKDMDEFWHILDERLELCHKALLWRHQHLMGTKSDAAPILWQHGALARLNKGETIDALLKDGYSTMSLGYAGIYECVMAMLGVSHTTPEGKKFAIDILKHLNEKCDEWNAEHNMGASVYGSPIEMTTYKFAAALKKRFGIIKGITDHDYITNSYHTSVREPIDAFSKLSIEGEFQKYSLGGAISYIEMPSMMHNIEAIIKVIQHIYDHCMYAELNTKSDYCQACGFDGEIQIIEDENGHLDWECPRCGNRDHNTLTVTRRSCGYLGTQFWNQGRTEEIRDRVLHL